MTSNHLQVGVPLANRHLIQTEIGEPTPANDNQGLLKQADALCPVLAGGANQQLQRTGEAAGLGKDFLQMPTHDAFCVCAVPRGSAAAIPADLYPSAWGIEVWRQTESRALPGSDLSLGQGDAKVNADAGNGVPRVASMFPQKRRAVSRKPKAESQRRFADGNG